MALSDKIWIRHEAIFFDLNSLNGMSNVHNGLYLVLHGCEFRIPTANVEQSSRMRREIMDLIDDALISRQRVNTVTSLDRELEEELGSLLD